MYYGLNTCIEYAIMHICRFLFVCVSICLFTSLRLMSARLSVFLFICVSVCLYVCRSSVCRLLCLLLSIHRSVYMSYCVLGRVFIYFSLCVVQCENPILLFPGVLLLVQPRKECVKSLSFTDWGVAFNVRGRLIRIHRFAKVCLKPTM